MSDPVWTAQVDDTVGGYIVTTYPHPLSAHDTRPDGDPTKCGRIMAECCCVEDAELVAGLLNKAGVPECDRPVPMSNAPERCGLCGKPIVERPGRGFLHLVAYEDL